MGLASEGARYIEEGLSAGVVETILSSRAPSTRNLYSLKWRLFSEWCTARQLNPVNCPVPAVLEFLQEKFSTGLSPSTLKVYVAAIGAFHTPIEAGSLGKHQLVVQFLRGARRMRPAAHSRVPTWDLAVVLEGLSAAPFEPLESAEAKNLTLKLAFLLAITSLRRVGDLQALAISPTCLEFAPGDVKAILTPRAGYVPKVPSSGVRSVVLQAFHPPPHGTAEEARLHLLCPVRALRIYLEKSVWWRKSDQLMVCFGSPKKGLPATKQTISNWIVQAIATAYRAWLYATTDVLSDRTRTWWPGESSSELCGPQAFPGNWYAMRNVRSPTNLSRTGLSWPRHSQWGRRLLKHSFCNITLPKLAPGTGTRDLSRWRGN
ncbi:MAG: hypothetical protein ACRCW3_03885, partial [Metamycoplasmataceae bacterium]